ncbi:MAG: DUF6106 family protein [Bacillota bacterium]|nr:DUF6106 family protein [Bacillota bacterium]
MRLDLNKKKTKEPSAPEPLSQKTVEAIEARRAMEEAEQEAVRAAAPVEQVTEEEAASALSRAYAQYSREDHESFIEVLVRPRRRPTDWMQTVGIIFAYLLLVYLALVFVQYIAFLLPLIVFGGAWGAWYAITSQSREYEYVVTNGDLDIDTVIARRRRRRSFQVKGKEIEVMASCSSDEYRQAESQKMQTRDYTVKPGDPKNWFIISQFKGQRQLTLISPEERVIRAMHRFNPSRVRYNRMTGL